MDAYDNSNKEKDSGGGASCQRKRGATKRRARALAAEVATPLQESCKAREANKQKRQGILARLREREAELVATTNGIVFTLLCDIVNALILT